MDTVNIPRIVVEDTGCGNIMSVSLTPNQGRLRTLSNVEFGAAPLAQHYLVFSVGRDLDIDTMQT